MYAKWGRAVKAAPLAALILVGGLGGVHAAWVHAPTLTIETDRACCLVDGLWVDLATIRDTYKGEASGFVNSRIHRDQLIVVFGKKNVVCDVTARTDLSAEGNNSPITENKHAVDTLGAYVHVAGCPAPNVSHLDNQKGDVSPVFFLVSAASKTNDLDARPVFDFEQFSRLLVGSHGGLSGTPIEIQRVSDKENRPSTYNGSHDAECGHEPLRVRIRRNCVGFPEAGPHDWIWLTGLTIGGVAISFLLIGWITKPRERPNQKRRRQPNAGD